MQPWLSPAPVDHLADHSTIQLRIRTYRDSFVRSTAIHLPCAGNPLRYAFAYSRNCPQKCVRTAAEAGLYHLRSPEHLCSAFLWKWPEAD
jgi:hypothetical protein